MRRWLILPAMLLPFLLWYDYNFRIRVRPTELPHTKVRNEVRIAHIGDLHGLNWGDDNRIIVEQIARHDPDLICITGPLHDPGDESGRIIAAKLIASLRSIAPTFFESKPINQSLCVGNTQLHISSGPHALPVPQTDAVFRLLLCRSPSLQIVAQSDYDLLLCNVCAAPPPNVLVTAGLGNAAERLFHPPEIHIITLKPPQI